MLKAAAHRTLPQVFVDLVPFFKIYSEYLKVQGGHHDTTSSSSLLPDGVRATAVCTVVLRFLMSAPSLCSWAHANSA